MRVIILFIGLAIFSIRSSSQVASNYWNFSITNLKSENYIRAIENINKYLEHYPQSAPAFNNRAYAKLQMNDKQGACQDFNHAYALGLKSNRKRITFMCEDEGLLERLQKIYYKDVKIYPENGFRPYYTRKDTLRGMLTKDRSCYDVTFYNLYVKVIPKQKCISGRNTIYFQLINNTKRIQIDLFDTYTINQIVWHDMQLLWNREFDAIFVNFPDSLIAGQMDSITVFYEGKPRIAPKPPWDGGFVWSHTKTSKQWIGVACEGLGASSWWPCKDHLSDKPDSMRISIGVPKPYNGVSNGRLIGIAEDGNDYRTYTWFVDYPINNYNATLYIGNFQQIEDTLRTPGFDTLVLDYYVLPKNFEKAGEYFKQVDTILNIYQNRFGPYPFNKDGYALVESPFEGMEHQGAIAYGNGFDRSKSHYKNPTNNFDGIIVHETAHEWWGNSVAASDMADLWIQEGMATYSELLFAEDLLGKDAYNLEVANRMKMILNIWPMVENRDVNENSFAGGDIYMKGAIMIHNFRCALNNDSLFNQIILGIATTYKYKTITSNDFIAFVNSATEDDYSALFHKFMYERYPPVFRYNYTRSDNKVLLACQWENVEEGFRMPVCLKLDDSTNIRLEVTNKIDTFTLPNTYSFRFYTQWSDPKKADWNSYTYFWTRRDESLKIEGEKRNPGIELSNQAE